MSVRRPDDDAPIVLYDGDCGFCQRTVRWILRTERDHALRFAPLQGLTADALRERHALPTDLSTLVFVSDGRMWLRSQAVMRLSRHLRAPWRWLYWLRWMPSLIADLPYRLVARVRHRLASRCALPTDAERARFLA